MKLTQLSFCDIKLKLFFSRLPTGAERAEQIYREVGALHSQGVFRDGQVVSRQVQGQARGMIRGDKITWVTGGEPNCSGIGQLVSVVDSLVAKANKHQDAGELANYNITWRTRVSWKCVALFNLFTTKIRLQFTQAWSLFTYHWNNRKALTTHFHVSSFFFYQSNIKEG